MRRRTITILVVGLTVGSCDQQSLQSERLPNGSLPVSVSRSDQPWLVLLAAAREGDFVKAHAMMVADYRTTVPIEGFRAAIEHNPLIARHTAATTYSYGGGRGDGGSLHAQGSILTPVGVVRFEAFYVEESGQPRLVALSVTGVPVVGLGVPLPSTPPAP